MTMAYYPLYTTSPLITMVTVCSILLLPSITTSPLITMVTVCSVRQLPSIPPLHSLPWLLCAQYSNYPLYPSSLITMVTVCSILLLPSIPPLHSLPWLLRAQYSYYPLYHLSTHYHGYCVLNTPTTLYTTSPLITMVTVCSILLLPSIPPLHSLPWLLRAQYSYYPLYHLSTHYRGFYTTSPLITMVTVCSILQLPLYTTSPLITMVTVCSILQRSMNMNFKLCSLGTCLSNFRLCPSNFRALAFVSSHKKALSWELNSNESASWILHGDAWFRYTYSAWKPSRCDLGGPKFQNFPGGGGMPPDPPKRVCFCTLTFACCAALYMCPTCARATILFWLRHWYEVASMQRFLAAV